MAYQPNIPTGSVPLNIDYQNLRTNFTALNTIFGVDHLTYNNATAQKGYHTNIHMVPAGSNPSAVVGYGTLYNRTTNDGYDSDQTLFFLTGDGKRLQLTSNVSPSLANTGYTFLPGGLILQWGRTNIQSTGNVPIVFPLAFANAVYSAQVTYSITDNTTVRSGISAGTLSTTGFTWEGTNSSQLRTLFWMVIGS